MRMGSGLCQLRQGWQQVKRDMRMGSGLCQLRRGWQHMQTDMKMGSGLCKRSKARRETSNDKTGINWETKYDEFEIFVVEESRNQGTKLHTWQYNQLSNGSKGLNAKIKKELAEKNEGSIVWSDRREKLDNCVVQKKPDAHGIKWENQYAELESYDGMPAIGTTLYSWQYNQLSNGS
jgi:hypothetical protein